jgi:hypothetical protein
MIRYAIIAGPPISAVMNITTFEIRSNPCFVPKPWVATLKTKKVKPTAIKLHMKIV